MSFLTGWSAFVLLAEAGVKTVVQAEPATLSLVAGITVFVLAIFVGVEIITKIPPTLHTPLMSGSNAISGITVVGALLAAGAEHGGFACFLGMVAVAMATINVVGGFLVTNRMLEMFRRK
jgi:NAD(P) transhydrogenase subunit alpha